MSQSTRPTFTIASLISLIAAIASFMQGAILGLLLAIVAMIFGLFGLLMSLSARKRGGFVSFAAILMGGIGVIAAVIKAVMWLIS